jgi:hypothetical protein
MSDEYSRIVTQHQSPGGPVVVQVRGSLLVSSLQTLRELGYYDRYLGGLRKELHEPVLFALASSWVPIEVALGHYAACESMELEEQDLDAMGKHVGARIMGTFLGTLVRSSRIAASRPLLALQHYPRLWERLMSGGSCTVEQKGPKDALIDSRGVPMFRFRYFRVAYSALIRGAGGLLGRAVHTRITRSTDSAMGVFVSWV